MSEIVEALSEEFQLTPSERKELLPSGKQTIMKNRVGWTRTYLKKATLVHSPKRGAVCITSAGKKLLDSKPDRIDRKSLLQFPEFVAFTKTHHRQKGLEMASTEEDWATPEEILDAAYQQLRDELESELLDQVKKASPHFFEQLVVDLLVRMGYGGSLQDAGQAVGKSGDGGIDGIIKEDRLGLDLIYIQAKGWEGTVGRPEIQKFAGALQGHRARKGVFITTSSFTKEAKAYVSSIENKIVLLDGRDLANYMIDHDVGVSTLRRLDLKKIDMDYFLDD